MTSLGRFTKQKMNDGLIYKVPAHGYFNIHEETGTSYVPLNSPDRLDVQKFICETVEKNITSYYSLAYNAHSFIRLKILEMKRSPYRNTLTQFCEETNFSVVPPMFKKIFEEFLKISRSYVDEYETKPIYQKIGQQMKSYITYIPSVKPRNTKKLSKERFQKFVKKRQLERQDKIGQVQDKLDELGFTEEIKMIKETILDTFDDLMLNYRFPKMCLCYLDKYIRRPNFCLACHCCHSVTLT